MLKLTAIDEEILEKLYRLDKASYRTLRDTGEQLVGTIRPIRSRKLRERLGWLEARELIRIESSDWRQGKAKWHSLTGRGRRIAERIVWLSDDKERVLGLSQRDYRDLLWIVEHYQKSKQDPSWILSLLYRFLDSQEPRYLEFDDQHNALVVNDADSVQAERHERLRQAIEGLRLALSPWISETGGMKKVG